MCTQTRRLSCGALVMSTPFSCPSCRTRSQICGAQIGRWSPLRWNSTEIRCSTFAKFNSATCISLPGLATGGVSSDIPVISVWCDNLRGLEKRRRFDPQNLRKTSAILSLSNLSIVILAFFLLQGDSGHFWELAAACPQCTFRAWHRRFLAADVSVIQRFLDLDEKLMQSFLYRSQNPRGKRMSPSCDRPLKSAVHSCRLHGLWCAASAAACLRGHGAPWTFSTCESTSHSFMIVPDCQVFKGCCATCEDFKAIQSLTVSNRFWIWIIWLCLKIGYPQIPWWIISFSPLDISIDMLTHFGCFRTHPCVKKLRHSASSPPISCYLGVPRSEHASDTSDWGRGSSWAKLSRHSELPTLSNMGRVWKSSI